MLMLTGETLLKLVNSCVVLKYNLKPRINFCPYLHNMICQTVQVDISFFQCVREI